MCRNCDRALGARCGGKKTQAFGGMSKAEACKQVKHGVKKERKKR